MNKTEKRMKIFTLIMQVIIQAVLLFPWMNMGTWKCNVPGYLIKLAASGDGMSYIKKSLKPLGVLDGADEQMMVQILMLFICELVMVLVIQVIGIVNLILALSNHHKLLLDIMSLIAGCMISFLGADGVVFSDPLSQVYPFLLVVFLVINLIGAKLIDSWQEEKKIQEEVKAREKNYKEEKKKHLEFSGKYPKGFYTALWKNFKSSKRDFIVYVSMNLLPATLIFSGVGMAQMLAPFNKEGNILTGHGITAILLEFLIVSLIASLMLMITNLLSYFRKRMRNYSIFSTLGMRKNAEGLRILLFIFLGIYLAEKFGFGLFLKVRKHKKSYYAKLIPYNSFYYRFKSTFRYVYVISLIPVLILFLFGKDMISAKIAQKPEGLFPYDFVCMATEADKTFWKQLQEKYDVKFQEYPMVRVTNVDNSEKLDDARAVIMPQGQHIGISETTYKELNKALGKKSEKMNLSADGKEIYIIYQQDKSTKAHPLDYLNSRKEPYLHIGQPIESYGFLDREKIYPTRTVKGEKMDILTGAFRQGSEENLVVFSDEYFEKVQDDWKKYNWITGDPVEEGEAEEGVTIHHWPTKLVLLNVKNVDYQKIEKELQAFRKVHKEDERFDKDVLSCYSKRTTMEQIESERFMTTVVDIFIMGAFLLGSVLVIYLKYESEMTDKKKRNHFLTCIGMSSKEREKLIRTETGIFFWIPAAVAVVMVPVLTGEMWTMREYTKADGVHYLRYLLILAVIYLVVQGIGVKVIEQYTIRKVEGKHERNIKGK